jgi:hypothetical protein
LYKYTVVQKINGPVKRRRLVMETVVLEKGGA